MNKFFTYLIIILFFVLIFYGAVFDKLVFAIGLFALLFVVFVMLIRTIGR